MPSWNKVVLLIGLLALAGTTFYFGFRHGGVAPSSKATQDGEHLRGVTPRLLQKDDGDEGDNDDKGEDNERREVKRFPGQDSVGQLVQDHRSAIV